MEKSKQDGNGSKSLSINDSLNQSKIEIDIKSDNDEDCNVFNSDDDDDFFRDNSFSLDSLSNNQKKIIFEEFCEILSDAECCDENDGGHFNEQSMHTSFISKKFADIKSGQTNGDSTDASVAINQMLHVM